MSFSRLLMNSSGIGALGMLVAVATVGIAAAYLWRPDERRLALMRPMSLATIFAALCTFSVGIATILQGIAATTQFTTGSWQRIAMGTAEAFIPVFGAFGCLAVAWLLVALGQRRTAYEDSLTSSVP